MRREYDDEAPQENLDTTIGRLARAQYGIFSREQVTSAGGTKDSIHGRVKNGRWERIAPSVYRVAGSAPSWRQTLLAACLSWGKGAAASHRGGAPLWNLVGFGPGEVELTVPRNRGGTGPGIVHRTFLPPVDVTVVDAIPVTTPARTLIDLTVVADPNLVEEALDDALRRGIVSFARMRWRLNELATNGRLGIVAMRRMLDARDPAQSVPQSVFERRVLRALREGGLPSPVTQHEIRVAGRLVARVDFAYPDAMLAIEADGYRWHSGRRRWDHDRARRNRLTLLGWRVIHVTWTDLTQRPGAIVAEVTKALKASPGWEAPPSPIPSPGPLPDRR